MVSDCLHGLGRNDLTDCCFTYGSLMCADIMSGVAGGDMRGEPAALAGYARHPVTGEDYPGVVAHPGGRVEGVLYRGVGPSALSRLDAFEGEMYARCRVEVNPVGGAPVAAWCYIVLPAHEPRLLPGDWDFAAFLAEGKSRFLARYGGFAAITPEE